MEQIHLESKSEMKEDIFDKCMMLVISVLIFTGFFAVESCFFSSNLMFYLALAAGVLPIAGMLFFDSDRGHMVVGGVCAMIGIVLIFMNLSGFSDGMLTFANHWIDAWNHHFNEAVSEYKVDGISETSAMEFWVILNLLLGMVTGWLGCRKQLLYYGLVGVFLINMAVFLELRVPVWAFLTFGCGMIMAFFGRKRTWNKAIYGLVGVVFLAVLAISLGQGMNIGGNIAGVKQSILDGIDEFRYGSDTLPQGDMTEASTMVGSEEDEALIVTGSAIHTMHFRGYVGSNFENNQWNEGNSESYYKGNHAGMLDWLSSQNFGILNQLQAYGMLSNQGDKPYSIHVENVGAYSKYVYLPYEYIQMMGQQDNQKYDWQMESKGLFGDKEYSMLATNTRLANDGAIFQKIDENKKEAGSYKKAEAVYQQFVKENYLTVSNTDAKPVKQSILKNKDWSDSDFQQITKQIRLSLMQIGTYDDQADAYDGTGDFVSWFLDNNRKSNAAYYATIAVLAYRCAGLPARYVEGYYLKENQIGSSVTLTQKDSHAWVEVYVDGMGWFPVEVTPGFYTAEYSLREVAPSPESTVSVVKDTQDILQGSTGDQLETSPKQDERMKPKPPMQQVVEALGVAILVCLILLFLLLIIRLQGLIRQKNLEKKMSGEDGDWQCALAFLVVAKTMQVTGMEFDIAFPQNNTRFFQEKEQGLTESEYKRFVELIEKRRFSGKPLTEAEYETVIRFMERLVRERYVSANLINKWRLRYIYAFI